MKISLSFIVLSGLLSTAVYAQNVFNMVNPFDDNGHPVKFYGGVSTGLSKHSDTCKESFINQAECDDSDPSWKVYGGVRLSPMFGVEGSYRHLGNTTVTGVDNANNPAKLEKEVAGFDLQAVGYYPMMSNLEIFGKAGIMYWQQKVSKTEVAGTLQTRESQDSGASLLLGAGAEYQLHQNIKLRTEWERVFNAGSSTTSATDIDMLSAGITFSAF